jgi:ribulose-5-phosphate 4-epimerase/fuculose-1-phosphate aldolase
VARKDVEAACYAIEELEETARLATLLRCVKANALTGDQVQAVETKFNVECDA